MFSTCLTAHDALTRVSLDIVSLLKPKTKIFHTKLAFGIGVILLTIINFIVIAAFSANMGKLVALATFVSFIVAPIVGYMNLKNVTSSDLDPSFWPGKKLRILTYTGILFLSCFSLYYFYIVLF
jgi:Mn2+/Fe2+ NRAMP family transporter